MASVVSKYTCPMLKGICEEPTGRFAVVPALFTVEATPKSWESHARQALAVVPPFAFKSMLKGAGERLT
jgi:hypothetical protein